MVTTFRLRTTAYAAGLAAVVALAGCSGGGVQAGGPSTQVSAKTSTAVVPSTTSPTTTAPVDPVLARIPAAARPETISGATNYVTFYFSTLNEAFMAADSTLLEQLSRPECKMCVAMVEGVEGVKQIERRYASDLVVARDPRPVKFTSKERTVLVEVKQNAVDVLDDHGSVVDTLEGGAGRYVFTLTYTGRWFVSRIQKVTA